MNIKNLILVCLIFLLVACEYKPPEHANSIQLNKWMSCHFYKTEDQMHRLGLIFKEYPHLNRLHSFDVQGKTVGYDPIIDTFSQELKDEIVTLFDKVGLYDVERAESNRNKIEFYGGKSMSKIGPPYTIRHSIYIYHIDGMQDKANICSTKSSDYSAQRGNCQIILNDKFTLQHWWVDSDD